MQPTKTDDRAQHAPRRDGFTLIEMLVVLVIIAILAGMVFSLMGLVGKNSDVARTRKTVELLANAVEEFRAEYGKYPPVPLYGGEQPVTYEYAVLHKPDHPTGMTDSLATQIANSGDYNARVYTFGLLSFLMTRYKDHAVNSPTVLTEAGRMPRPNPQWYEHNTQREDRTRDERAISRFEPYLDEIVGSWYEERTYSGTTYTNDTRIVLDAWDRSLRYASTPPYDSYKLWSDGPDGISGTSDDIVAGKEGK